MTAPTLTSYHARVLMTNGLEEWRFVRATSEEQAVRKVTQPHNVASVIELVEVPR
jgi:hypothetical protein